MLPYVGPTLQTSGMNKYHTQLYILIPITANLRILYFSVYIFKEIFSEK
jgi:hypothetical protein